MNNRGTTFLSGPLLRLALDVPSLVWTSTLGSPNPGGGGNFIWLNYTFILLQLFCISTHFVSQGGRQEHRKGCSMCCVNRSQWSVSRFQAAKCTLCNLVQLCRSTWTTPRHCQDSHILLHGQGSAYSHRRGYMLPVPVCLRPSGVAELLQAYPME